MFSLGGGVQVSLMISSYATGRLESLLSLTLPKRKNNKYVPKKHYIQ